MSEAMDRWTGKLKQVGVADIERVIAEALNNLAGEDYDAEITQIEFTNLGQGANITLKIRPRLKPWPGER